MLPRLVIALHLALLVGALNAGHAQAQGGRDVSLGAELDLVRALPLAPTQVALAGLVPLGPYQLDPKLQPEPSVTMLKAQRKARLLVAIGSGLLASAALHVSLMSPLACEDVPAISIGLGAVMASIGLGLTIAGAKRLAPREQRRPTSPARKFGLVMLALTTLLVSELGMLAVSFDDINCED